LKGKKKLNKTFFFFYKLIVPIFAKIPSRIQRHIPNTFETSAKSNSTIGKWGGAAVVFDDDDELSTKDT